MHTLLKKHAPGYKKQIVQLKKNCQSVDAYKLTIFIIQLIQKLQCKVMCKSTFICKHHCH